MTIYMSLGIICRWELYVSPANQTLEDNVSELHVNWNIWVKPEFIEEQKKKKRKKQNKKKIHLCM